jgi:FkbH-like protein
MNFSEVKIIIWDLDETLWRGTIAENPKVDIRWKIIEKIEKLNKIGIINSICSNNDFSKTSIFLKKEKIYDLFIYPSINYQPKGLRIKSMLKELGLRDSNAIFIDDNFFNLKEAKYYNKNLRCINITKINVNNLIENIMRNAKPNKDRFDQYKNLELKINQREKFESNEKFLFDSNIILDTVSVTRDNFNIYKNRISELTSRTNQLNYTKVREDVFEIKKRLKHTKNFIFKVKDKYGNYGVVGFASFEKSRKKVYHYLFSCRIINMGIENHAAKTIDLPEFFPDENVISKYEKKACPWIKNGEVEELSANHILKDTLFLGGCDLERSLHFISSKDRIETYFNYITSGGINVHRDSIDLLLIDDIEDDKIDYIISTVPFLKNHKGMGIKDIKNLDFSKYKNIIYSPLIDYNQEKFISKNVPGYYLSSTPALHGEYSEDDLIKLSNSSKINIEELKKMTRHWKHPVSQKSFLENK